MIVKQRLKIKNVTYLPGSSIDSSQVTEAMIKLGLVETNTVPNTVPNTPILPSTRFATLPSPGFTDPIL